MKSRAWAYLEGWRRLNEEIVVVNHGKFVLIEFPFVGERKRRLAFCSKWTPRDMLSFLTQPAFGGL